MEFLPLFSLIFYFSMSKEYQHIGLYGHNVGSLECEYMSCGSCYVAGDPQGRGNFFPPAAGRYHEDVFIVL